MKFTKKDFYFSIVTGLITGFVAWRIFEYLNVPILSKGYGESHVICGIVPPCWEQYAHYIYIPWFTLVIVVPVLWILGVNLGYFLGRWFRFFNQFGKFSAIGFTNAAVDFGVLNLLIANTGISGGGWYPVFKGISFVCAIIPSYFWNKYWAFRPAADVDRGVEPQRQKVDQGSAPDNVGTGTFEFAKFMSVAIVAILINDGVASLVVNYVDPMAGLNSAVWANVGAVIGSATALVFSFLGFKVAVFKR